MPKKYLLKSSKIIAHNYTYLGKKDFNHASKLVKALEAKGPPLKIYTNCYNIVSHVNNFVTDRYNIVNYASENGLPFKNFDQVFSNLLQSTRKPIRT